MPAQRFACLCIEKGTWNILRFLPFYSLECRRFCCVTSALLLSILHFGSVCICGIFAVCNSWVSCILFCLVIAVVSPLPCGQPWYMFFYCFAYVCVCVCSHMIAAQPFSAYLCHLINSMDDRNRELIYHWCLAFGSQVQLPLLIACTHFGSTPMIRVGSDFFGNGTPETHSTKTKKGDWDSGKHCVIQKKIQMTRPH